MLLTKEQIGAQACIDAGGLQPISSFDDGSAESIALKNNYELIVEAELSIYPWRFSTTQVALAAPLTDTPVIRYSHAWQLPPEAMWVRGVYLGDKPQQYDIVGDKLMIDADQGVEVEYSFRAAESLWAPYFAMGLKFRVAALLARHVAENAEIAKLNEELAEMWIGRARTVDAQSKPSRNIRAHRLIGVRRSGGYSYGTRR